MKALLLIILGALVFGASASAQGRIEALPLQGRLRHITYGGRMAKAAPKLVYSNTLNMAGAYFYGVFGQGEEPIDYGVITSNDDHDTITDLTFGYASASSTTSVRVRIYDGYTGFCGFRDAPVLDMTLTGLPGLPGGGVTADGLGWVVSVDLSTLQECFYLEEVPFGYSYTFSDDFSGPILALGGTGTRNWIDWTPSFLGTCSGWTFGGVPWSGFYTELGAHDGNDTFSGGCHGPLSLDMIGATCPGNTVSISISGASVGDWWAVALGTSIGAGISGSLGGCPIDLVPVIPIRVMGQLPTQPLTFPATVTFASGLTVGIQVITKNPTSGIFDSSNTEILNVP